MVIVFEDGNGRNENLGSREARAILRCFCCGDPSGEADRATFGNQAWQDDLPFNARSCIVSSAC
jgi:hypothetical protein